ncbi:MAG: hypothetical protein MJ247_04800 [Alphaproteobacteria bacterium]|nr:hypothetical protein [Alphaproteobacteria bacterium]
MKYNQIVNKENTSCSVFWGMISLGVATLVSTVVFNIPLEPLKQKILVSIAILSLLFFSFGEGKKLSKYGKKAFVYTIVFATLNNICDVLGIKFTNWYVMYFFTIFLMLLFSLVISGKKISVLNFFTKKVFYIAGIIFALGEVVLMFSMQYFFPVVVALFIVRVSQSFVLIIAHYVNKEGKISTQFLFALGMIFISYFFFFGR